MSIWQNILKKIREFLLMEDDFRLLTEMDERIIIEPDPDNYVLLNKHQTEF